MITAVPTKAPAAFNAIAFTDDDWAWLLAVVIFIAGFWPDKDEP